MATVVHYALHADQLHARVAKVPHGFLGVCLAKIGFFQKFLLSLRVIKSYEVFGQLFWLERLSDRSSADGADSESLLLDFDEALFAESVPAVEVPRHAVFAIEELVTRGAVHEFKL